MNWRLATIFFVFSFTLFFLLLLIKGREKKMANSDFHQQIRAAAAAGSFYPEDKESLKKQINDYLNFAGAKEEIDHPQIIFVPHAGLEYSGKVAALSFKQIQNQNYQKIILLGSSHHFYFDHAAVDPVGVWQTPLGKVEIDSQTVKQIIDPDQNIRPDSQKHVADHVLEMEVIFLQSVLSDFKIIPLLVSNASPKLKENLAQKITAVFDQNTLLVVSTDLSHYPSYEQAQKADEQTIAGILSGDPKEFTQAFQQVLAHNYPGLETPACGQQAIEIALRVGQILKIENYELLAYQNSGDSPLTDKERVVGYTAIIGWTQKTTTKSVPDNLLDPQAQTEALKLARQILENYLETRKITSPKISNPQLQAKAGAFVTLRKNNDLRGCIGSFEEDRPLGKVISEMAIAAATNDPRFSPVTAKELSQIKIEISVLTPKKKINDWRKIVLGQDGVVIEKAGRSGTFLPQVAVEAGWNLEEFLGQLCSQKAGLAKNCYQDLQTNIYTFQAQVFEEK